tara:strand:+ start:101 stop:541 length:441 start_codon:yes stop_codon:yes gene_type:complete
MLTGTEKAAIQVLLSRGIVSDEDMQDYVKRIKQDFPLDDNLILSEMFKRINESIGQYSMEVRSVVMKGQAGEEPSQKYYHGISNIKEDNIAKNFGTEFNENEGGLCLGLFFCYLLPCSITTSVFKSPDLLLSCTVITHSHHTNNIP